MEFLKSGPNPAKCSDRIREGGFGGTAYLPAWREKAVWPLVVAREEYIFNALEPGERLALARVCSAGPSNSFSADERTHRPTDALTLPSTPLTKTQDASTR